MDSDPIARLNVFCQAELEIAQRLRATYNAENYILVDDFLSFLNFNNNVSKEIMVLAERVGIDLRAMKNETTDLQPVNVATEIDDDSADLKRIIDDMISDAFNDSMTATNLFNISLSDPVFDIAQENCPMASHTTNRTANTSSNTSAITTTNTTANNVDEKSDEEVKAANKSPPNWQHPEIEHYELQDDLNIQAEEIVIPAEMNDSLEGSETQEEAIILLPTLSETVTATVVTSPSDACAENSNCQDSEVIKQKMNENEYDEPEKAVVILPTLKTENKPPAKMDLKRRRSMDWRIISPISAMTPLKKRHSAARKSVSFERSQIFFIDSIQMQPTESKQVAITDNLKEIPDENVSGYQNRKRNTDIEMHCKNPQYRTHCPLCNKSFSHLPKHYGKHHPNHEVPIARPPPSLAKKLRSNALGFIPDDGKLLGACCFCEERKSMNRRRWATHLLAHSGEKAFSCATCKMEFDFKTEHVMHKCPRKTDEEPIDIFHTNSNGPLVGFMCKDCNYLQIKHDRMMKHLKNEHAYNKPMENYHYRSYTLVPFSSIVKK